MSRLWKLVMLSGLSLIATAGCDEPPRARASVETSRTASTAMHVSADANQPQSVSFGYNTSRFGPHHDYSYGATIVRDQQGVGCASLHLYVANGFDHTPQYAFRRTLWNAGTKCMANSSPPTEASARALYYSDVAVLEDDLIALAALGDPLGRTEGGGVYSWKDGSCLFTRGDTSCGGCGFPASGIAAGDISGDGRLDLVVGTFDATAPRPVTPSGPRFRPSGSTNARPRTRQHTIKAGLGFPFSSGARPRSGDPIATPKDLSKCDRSVDKVRSLATKQKTGPLGVFTRNTNSLTDKGEKPLFDEFCWIPSRSPAQLRLLDLDQNGQLDIVAGGFGVQVIMNPGSNQCADVHDLAFPGSPSYVYALGVDAVRVKDRVIVAASRSCAAQEKCSTLLGDSGQGVQLWSFPCDANGCRPTPDQTQLLKTSAIASSLRFAASNDGDDQLDLVVAQTISPADRCEDPLAGYCLGSPVVVFRGTKGSAHRFDERPVAITHERAMAYALEPYEGTQELRDSARCFALAGREQACAAAVDLPTCSRLPAGSTLTLSRDGFVARVYELTSYELDDGNAAKAERFHHIYGEPHIAMAPGARECLRVKYGAVDKASFLVTGMSPLPDSGEGLNIYLPSWSPNSFPFTHTDSNESKE